MQLADGRVGVDMAIQWNHLPSATTPLNTIDEFKHLRYPNQEDYNYAMDSKDDAGFFYPYVPCNRVRYRATVYVPCSCVRYPCGATFYANPVRKIVQCHAQ